ncbi:MAG: 4Fe-4S dicluster domain-containing protein [Desulfobacteraceae bacterium]|nr:MAG: 4Fe-4S dicluster domain-containing protein [Desulfobacteraceae bacterium]
MSVWIETDLCNGCKRCIKACPYDAIEMRGEKAFILERCTSCGSCISVCKQEAVKTDAVPRTIPDFSDWKGIWVFAEQRDGELLRVSLELLGKAKELGGELEQGVSAVILGKGIERLCDTLIRFGADTVHLVENESLRLYRTAAYTKVLARLVQQFRPSVLLMGATHLGRDLAPRLSRRIGVGLTADCTELSIDKTEKILLQTRPAFGGNVMATIANRYSRPQMATVRPGVMKTSEIPGQAGEVVCHDFKVEEKEIGTKVLELVREKKKKTDLSESNIIVAGGRGVGDRKGFVLLEELAELMGGELAGTRVAVEEGWISQDRQVGQTGHSVRPELYVACGISGAIQHRAGMMNSRYVAAINKDPRAPIFQVADWGIVGDLHEVVPEIIKQLKTGSWNKQQRGGGD